MTTMWVYLICVALLRGSYYIPNPMRGWMITGAWRLYQWDAYRDVKRTPRHEW